MTHTPWAPPRRAFEPDANDLDAKACKTTAGRVADFKRCHGLARGYRLSEPARALLLQELEADQRAIKGQRLAQAQALALIAERATPEAAQALAAIVPEQHRLFHAETGWVTAWDTEPYLLNRVEALTGKRYATAGAAWKRAAALAPAAAPAAPAERFRRILFWGVILRLDQLEGPPPADPRAFYSWCQLGAYQGHHTGPSLGDLMAGRMQEAAARALLELPATGPLDPGAIRTAYRAQARHHHPDAGGDRHRFEQLAAARDRLVLVEW
jgi:hypothetical protein